jgi:hypothetical protein
MFSFVGEHPQITIFVLILSFILIIYLISSVSDLVIAIVNRNKPSINNCNCNHDDDEEE